MLEIWHSDKESSATQKAYNDIYSGQGLLQRDSFYLWLISLLKPKPGRLLLDISCGQGRLVTLARQQKLTTMGADFAIEGLRVGIQRAPQSGWLAGDGECLPLADRSVDYVYHIGSLEHYLHPALGASEINRVLKPDGCACILLPNAFGIWGNIKHVWQHGEIFDDGQPLQRYATHRTWTNLLQGAGLHIQRTIGYGEINYPRTWQDVRWMLLRPQKVIRGVISLITPLNLSNHFVFICKRG